MEEQFLLKIYIGEKPLILTNLDQMQLLKQSGQLEGMLCLAYWGKTKFILNVVQQLEKSKNTMGALLYSNEPHKIFSDVLALAPQIEAAGGMVVNEMGKTLFIFRRGHWDLPKGKIDKGESTIDAARREVCEETGVCDTTIIRELTKTYHIYRDFDNEMKTKVTHWFQMDSNAKDLIPQITEDIETVGWYDVDEILQSKQPIYQNILEVLKVEREEL